MTRGSLSAGPLAADRLETPTAVWTSSLDGRPVASSRHLLIFHLVHGNNPNELPWRLKAKEHHTGMGYPTHGLGPVAFAMNINRGDRFDYLVSTGSSGFGCQDFARRKFGTDGVIGTYPLRAAFEKSLGAEAKDWMNEKELAAFRKEWQHPLWKAAGEIARASGGHGGMDFLMDLRWAYCLQQGLPVDMNVYDLATWSSIVQLSEESVRNRSKTMDIPDFTRGAWATTAPVGDMTIDVNKIRLDMDTVKKTGKQQTV